MAILKITYPPAQHDQLIDAEINLTHFFSNLLIGDIASRIIDHLTKYHSQNGDTCYIDGFEVSNVLLQDNKKTGTVIISYAIQYHYGCADITRQAKDHETWRFEVDADNHSLLLHMPEYEVRSTADEF
ncbi:MAG: hypothetical protein V4619_06280 [Bacteroidota bacterium]